MIGFLWLPTAIAVAAALQPEVAAIIRDLDSANQSRFDNVLSFTDVEHYTVYRGNDQAHPAAEMTVRTSYTKGIGKSYDIVSQSGSSLIQKVALLPLLDSEKAINVPAKVAQSWFTSSNYEMKLQPGITQTIDNRLCLALAITPRHKAPNMIEGTLRVDVGDHTLVEVEGSPSKSPSIFAGTTKMMRRYACRVMRWQSTRAPNPQACFSAAPSSSSTTAITTFSFVGESILVQRQWCRI
jgi:hypothetical protein